jgi:hypothetical protein
MTAEKLNPAEMIQPEDKEGLLTWANTNTAIGYLFGHEGVQWSPDGAVNCTEEQAKKHNELLDNMLVKGLDDSCEIGQGYHFYFFRAHGTTGHQVRSWMGQVISDNVQLNGTSIIFTRKGKTFRGRLRNDEPVFNFKRIK